MRDSTWAVGSNGNYFRDMAGFRYCVAHEIVGYLEDGRRIFKFSANRNGNQLGALLHETATAAKAACEADAAAVPA